MATKNNPGKFDCYANAAPDEPMFVLLGRDPMAGGLVREWASLRRSHGENEEKVAEAEACAAAMDAWATSLGKTLVTSRQQAKDADTVKRTLEHAKATLPMASAISNLAFDADVNADGEDSLFIYIILKDGGLPLSMLAKLDVEDHLRKALREVCDHLVYFRWRMAGEHRGMLAKGEPLPIIGAEIAIGTLHMFENGCPEWVIAFDVADAVKVYEVATGLKPGDHDGEDDWAELPGDKVVKFWLDDNGELSDGSNGRTLTPMTVDAACAKFGHGFYASSEF
jgi:hypothetical protein